MLRLCCFLGAGALLCGAQATIIDTGSTNRPGMSVTLAGQGSEASLERHGAASQAVILDKDLCDRLLRDLKAAGPLSALPRAHCMKSVSFGSSLFIEYNGVRSVDLSCPQRDPRAAALKKDAAEILAPLQTAPKNVYY